MQRILLISDTHGQLDIINESVEKSGATAVIHAGDFGFYEHDSFNRLSERELRLLIHHSSVKEEISRETKKQELIEIIQKHHLFGDFPYYLEGKRRFSVPVYAVWGNHEDIAVIEKLRKDNTIDHLFLLDENHLYDLPSFQLFGIGGNFLPGLKLFDPGLTGNGGKVFSTLHQYGVLYQKIKQKQVPSIFVSHVSPGKEPLLARLMSHFNLHFWISGHMGSPYTCVWNQFTVREEKEAMSWLDVRIESEGLKLTEDARIALELINGPMLDKEYWLKKPWNINLPDAKDGYAFLCIENGYFFIETKSFIH